MRCSRTDGHRKLFQEIFGHACCRGSSNDRKQYSWTEFWFVWIQRAMLQQVGLVIENPGSWGYSYGVTSLPQSHLPILHTIRFHTYFKRTTIPQSIHCIRSIGKAICKTDRTSNMAMAHCAGSQPCERCAIHPARAPRYCKLTGFRRVLQFIVDCLAWKAYIANDSSRYRDPAMFSKPIVNLALE